MGGIYKELADEIVKKIDKKAVGLTTGIQPELGTIMQNRSLKLDRFKYEINDYLIAESLTLQGDFFTATEANSGTHYQYEGSGAHDHKVVTPKEFKPIAPGDRVLAIQVNGGQDVVVICRVVNRA